MVRIEEYVQNNISGEHFEGIFKEIFDSKNWEISSQPCNILLIDDSLFYNGNLVEELINQYITYSDSKHLQALLFKASEKKANACIIEKIKSALCKSGTVKTLEQFPAEFIRTNFPVFYNDHKLMINSLSWSLESKNLFKNRKNTLKFQKYTAIFDQPLSILLFFNLDMLLEYLDEDVLIQLTSKFGKYSSIDNLKVMAHKAFTGNKQKWA